MRRWQREVVAALGMASTFRVDWARIDTEQRADWVISKASWQGGLYGRVRSLGKKWASGMGQLNRNEGKFWTDQKEP